ncbi:uncharacterized protein LOC105695047 isoform X2 [Orussus abietinus]|uniref:uncharacterized protein LOC105695047 isoform X2 n=1 Tax=Orussus abietinus TaxID=222816 RepID=UPI00062626BE|nr:uncharacterized protein LOC105695047 isoform X2 [Orussus abietinus]XP_012271696.1 uncharacterized protein LOC105695047 isoform X2 [Orussus abietinus]XP_012271697.1 uncharacterized protein LOC105695047 isoform X2 [Orussus abietinus]XP_012271699.1 uncharacterized protein LOC105695047 isoform X2 [Orussus abietinus]
MDGEIPRNSCSNGQTPSPDSGEDQKLLSPWNRRPIIVQPPKSPNASFRSRSRYRPGPVRKLRRRAVLKNGECNVLQSRISKRSLRFLQDIFTTLVDTQWRWTLLCFILSFLLSWLGFAVIWWLIAFTHGDFEEKHLPPFQEENDWTPCVHNVFSFTSCFLFSIETQHTIGYGSRSTSEECPEAIFVMCIQSIAGVMIQAFMVGIVFAKMTRPKQRTQTLLFSRNAVICQRDGQFCLMFRVGDMRKSHIIGATVRAQLIRSRTTREGEFLSQNQQELKVGTDGTGGDLFFIWPNTIVHRIDQESPFYDMSAEDMLTERFEVVVILEGTIESTGQTTQARSSYLPQEILWGHRFEPVVSYSKERQGYEVDYSLFDSTTQVDTPLCSGRELAEFYRVQDDLRHGTGFIVDEDGIAVDPHRDILHRYSSCHQPTSLLRHPERTRSTASVDSLEDPGKFFEYHPHCCHPHHPREPMKEVFRESYRIPEVDPDAIQVMAESDLRNLPEAVNREILKNSREIVYEEEIPREESAPQVRVMAKKGIQRVLQDEERKSPSGSRRSLANRGTTHEEERRSLNGSKRNLNHGKRYILVLEKPESWSENGRHCCCSREGSVGTRRHTGSRERLESIGKTVLGGARGCKESPEEPRSRRRNEDVCLEVCRRSSDEVAIDVERTSRSGQGPVQEVIPRDRPRTRAGSAASEDSSSPDSTRREPLQVECPRNPDLTLRESASSPSESRFAGSDSSPESGFVGSDGLRVQETAEANSALLEVDTAHRSHRRSYEHAQLQDVNEALSGSSSGNSEEESERAPCISSERDEPCVKRTVYTSV